MTTPFKSGTIYQGETLRERRQKVTKKSVEQMGEALGVCYTSVSSLESGRMGVKKFPSAKRLYIRNYGERLGLDGEEFLQWLQAQRDARLEPFQWDCSAAMDQLDVDHRQVADIVGIMVEELGRLLDNPPSLPTAEALELCEALGLDIWDYYRPYKGAKEEKR